MLGAGAGCWVLGAECRVLSVGAGCWCWVLGDGCWGGAGCWVPLASGIEIKMLLGAACFWEIRVRWA